MACVGPQTSLEELASIISQRLAARGIDAVLSGGAAVGIYTDHQYESFDLDFVTSARGTQLDDALAPLGFSRTAGAREFEHPDTDFYVEFPPGPLAFGETVFTPDDAVVLDTTYGPVRIVTPTHLVMDRLAAYAHWRDRHSLYQAEMVARHRPLDWDQLEGWAKAEGIDPTLVQRLRRNASSG